MGLRSFLLGAEQFGSGVESFRKAEQEKEKSLREELFNQGVIEKFGPDFGNLYADAQRAGINPVMSEGAKAMFLDALGKRGKDAILGLEEVKTLNPNVPEDAAQKIANLKDRKAQEKAIYAYSTPKDISKEERIDTRQSRQLGLQERKFKIANYKDLNNSLTSVEKAFETDTQKVKGALAAFKSNPNSTTLGQLAMTMSKSAGNSGTWTDADARNAKIPTLGQSMAEWDAYLTSNPEIAVTDQTRNSILGMAEVGLREAEKRKKNRLTSVYESSLSTLSPEVMRGKKPEVLKTWEKRLGLESRKTEEGLEITKSGRSFKGRAAEVMSAAAATKNPAMIQSVQNLLSKLPEGQDIGESAYSKIMQKISGGK